MTETKKLNTPHDREVFMKGVTDKVVALMEEHGADWTRPWVQVGMCGSYPVNSVTGHHYRGMNVLILGMSQATSGYKYPAWASEKQWQKRGAYVKEGEVPTEIVFFKPMRVTDPAAAGKTKFIPLLRVYSVYNYEQIEGLNLLMDEWFGYNEEEPPDYQHEKIEAVERYVANTGAVIKHGDNAAYYRPSSDHIQMPELNTFKEVEFYYATLLHELTHWTGAKKRLKRLQENLDSFRRYNEAYAFEELVAELGSAMQCGLHDIDKEPRADHAKYLNGWISKLKEDPQLIFRASARAQAAVDFCDKLQPEEE